ncbi:chemotaxis protein CheW [Paludicola sp. MB14-C6]|uniref:chemotaxis protein CheW n=1 Tax=Paludihabitans sp. MB14-C6 TaxID=3070656 RepID=UPI0027DBBA0E|nr:chemotaxis protein CheW [Paludicola sp. MB14-C6]WMJ21905.1 chemotaxis protein CheW [Paludicola sp. MB14-C6]
MSREEITASVEQSLLAQFNAETETDQNVEKYLTFIVDEQLYTVPSNQVIEIIGMQPVTYMPGVAEFIKGVINIRGKVVPLIELQKRLRNTSSEYTRDTCIVVIDMGDYYVGFIVDKVCDVTDVAESEISPAPKVSKKDKDHDFVSAIARCEKSVAMILDCTKVLGVKKDQAE